MVTTVSVNEETGRILRELSDRTKIPLMDIMDELGRAVRVILECGTEARRLNFMIDPDLKNRMVHLRFNENLTLADLPIGLQRKIRRVEKLRMEQEDGTSKVRKVVTKEVCVDPPKKESK